MSQVTAVSLLRSRKELRVPTRLALRLSGIRSGHDAIAARGAGDIRVEFRILRRHDADGNSAGRPAICHPPAICYPNDAVPSGAPANDGDHDRDRANKAGGRNPDICVFRVPAPE